MSNTQLVYLEALAYTAALYADGASPGQTERQAAWANLHRAEDALLLWALRVCTRAPAWNDDEHWRITQDAVRRSLRFEYPLRSQMIRLSAQLEA